MTPYTVILYTADPDTGDGVILVGSPSASAAASSALADLLGSGQPGRFGGFWDSIGGFFKNLGTGVVKVFRNCTSGGTACNQVLKDWINRRGGAAAVAGQVCVRDVPCGAFYILNSASAGADVAFRQASQGECLGKEIVDGSQLAGWVSPCATGAPPSIDKLGSWFESNWQLLAIIGGGLLVVKMMFGGRRR